MEPQPKLPSDLETAQGRAMIAGQRMACRVPRTAKLIKELGSFTRHDAMILQPPQHIELRFLRGDK
jgi:hypothetical protein